MEPRAFQPIGGDGGNTAAVSAQPKNGQGIITPTVVTEVGDISANLSPPERHVPTLPKPEKVEPKQKIAISLKNPLPPKDLNIKSLNDVATVEKIKLSEKKLQKKECASFAGNHHAATSSRTLPQANKKHAEDMSKWLERVKEIRDGGDADTSP